MLHLLLPRVNINPFEFPPLHSEEIQSVLLFRCPGEIECPGDNCFLVIDHDFILGYGVVRISDV